MRDAVGGDVTGSALRKRQRYDAAKIKPTSAQALALPGASSNLRQENQPNSWKSFVPEDRLGVAMRFDGWESGCGCYVGCAC